MRRIDPSSLQLTRIDGVGGVVRPRGMRMADMAGVAAESGCVAESADGFADLVLRFSAKEIATVLDLPADSVGKPIVLRLSGREIDGSNFEARDVLVIRER